MQMGGGFMVEHDLFTILQITRAIPASYPV